MNDSIIKLLFVGYVLNSPYVLWYKFHSHKLHMKTLNLKQILTSHPHISFIKQSLIVEKNKVACSNSADLI